MVCAVETKPHFGVITPVICAQYTVEVTPLPWMLHTFIRYMHPYTFTITFTLYINLH